MSSPPAPSTRRVCGPIPEPRQPTPGAPLLSARGLTRRYRRTTALEGVDLDLHPGEAVGLLGPNGAGKTTLLTILAGVARPSAGTVTVAPGGDGEAGGIGWAPQRPALYGRLTTRENLSLFAGLEGRTDPAAAADALLERGDLARFADQPAYQLSTGTLQRLNLCIALAGEPRVLLLDEPAATLSPEQRVRLWEWLGGLRRQERLALVFSTQSVGEAARQGDRLLVLAGGRLAFAGSAAELVRADGGDTTRPDAAERAFLRLLERADAVGEPA